MPVSPVKTRPVRYAAGAAVAAIWGEAKTVAVPEAAAAPESGTITRRFAIVVAVDCGELLIVLLPPKRVATGVACVAAEANTAIVAFRGNIEVAVLGVAVLTFPVKQVDT